MVGEGESAKVTSINVKDKINAGQINSVPDLLKDVPGIIVQSSPQSGTTVSMRGMTNDRILVAINGNVIENQGGLMRGRALEWDAIPVNNVKKNRDIRGANSALYGGTWGGVINIITTDKPGASQSFLKYSLGSFNDKKYAVGNQGTDKNGKISWNISADKRESDGFYRNNWTDMKDLNLNLSYNLTDEEKIALAWTNMDKKEGIIVGNGPTSVNGYDNRYPVVDDAPTMNYALNQRWLDNSYRQWKTNNYSLNYSNKDTSFNIYKSDQHRTEYITTKQVPALSLSWESNLESYGYRLQKSLKLKNHGIVYGAEYKKMDYDLLSSGADLKNDWTSLFVQDNWQINEKTILGLGARYDQHKLDIDVLSAAAAQKPREETQSQLSPKLSLTYQLNNKETVYGSVSRVFRPPTVSDYYRWSGNYYDTNGANFLAYRASVNPGITFAQWQEMIGVIEPEKGMSYEIGWRKEFSNRHTVKVTGYYNDIDNYVTSYSPPGSKGYPPTYNIENAKIKGIEIANDYQINKNLILVSNYTHQESSKTGDKFDPNGDEVTTIPKDTFNLGMRYDNEKGFRASWDTRYVGSIESGGTKLDSRIITDLAFSYSKKDSTISLGINNVFDQNYEETAGFPMPGINYSLSYQLAF